MEGVACIRLRTPSGHRRIEGSIERPPPNPPVATPERGDGALRPAGSFVRAHRWAIVAISAALLIPCFWHRHLVASDLASHVYNAWLASLIRRGQAPGLYLAPRSNNVLFDVILERLGLLVGWGAAERIAVSLSVLTFFWGAFALMSAVSRRAAWYLAPAIAMVAYGWTFEIGFSNYYLSLGLGFLSAALLWRGKGWELLLGAALLPVVLLAHPFGLAFVMGAVAYARIHEALPGRSKLLALAGATAVIFLVRAYLTHHYPVQWMAKPLPFYLMNGFNGVDQLVLGSAYKNLARLVFLAGVACFFADSAGRVLQAKSIKPLAAFSVPLALYAIALLATATWPDSIHFPQYATPVSFLLPRFSSISAVLALCVLSCVTPKKWHVALFGMLALIFFGLLYRDSGAISKMQDQVEQLVSQLPASQRVTYTIWSLPDSRLSFIGRMVDRECVGRCFSYQNYEPSTLQFRIRARPGNPIVASSVEDVDLMESGLYIVRPSDLPIYEIYQCDERRTILCMRELDAGEANGRIGFNPGVYRSDRQGAAGAGRPDR
jgi:hypothetical protein